MIIDNTPRQLNQALLPAVQVMKPSPKSLVALLTLLLSQAISASPKQPNIIFILTDDQRWDAAGYAGNDTIKTPEIDKLAHEGTIFRNHFVTTSICAVSRASILTGQYERRHGIADFTTPLSPEQWQATYPARLRDNGYYTGFIGKFGVGHHAKNVEPMSKHFDYWRGVNEQGGKYFIEPDDPQRLHQTARYGNQALEFIQAAPPGQPFCLSISFTAPHARDRMPREFTPDDRDENVYLDAEIPKPELADERYFQLLTKSVQNSIARERWTWRFDTPEKFQGNTKDYFRLVSGIDRELGRIREALAKKGVSENTVILFTSDNGYALGDRGLAGKWFMYEESIRVPLVIYDPRKTHEDSPPAVEALTLNIDLAPTLLALAGIEAPDAMQGRSLGAFLVNDPAPEWRSHFFYEHHYAPARIPPCEGVRSARWSYIRWVNESPTIEELYDLETDPLQINNLADKPEHATTLGSLRDQWQTYAETLK